VSLHPVLGEKLSNALEPAVSAQLTRREVRLPAVPGKAHAVIGMRRAGKTTFLRQLLDERRAYLPPERALYLSFDDDRLAGIAVDQLGFLLEEFYRRHPALRGRETVHWFLDEIQLVPGWDRFVRRVLDSEKVEVVVSGSSARMLSREVHTSLRGRGMATVIRPFSFREFLRHRGEEPTKEARSWTAAGRSLVEMRFREFLIQGGFPEVQGLAAGLRIELLQGYVDTVLFRDIVERYGVSQVAALRWLVRQCLRNPAGSFSAHRLHLDLKAQGNGVGKDAVHEFLGHLADAFLLSAVGLATESERQRNSNPRKIYPADPGLIRAFDASGTRQVRLTGRPRQSSSSFEESPESGLLKMMIARQRVRDFQPPHDFEGDAIGQGPPLVRAVAIKRDSGVKPFCRQGEQPRLRENLPRRPSIPRTRPHFHGRRIRLPPPSAPTPS